MNKNLLIGLLNLSVSFFILIGMFVGILEIDYINPILVGLNSGSALINFYAYYKNENR